MKISSFIAYALSLTLFSIFVNGLMAQTPVSTPPVGPSSSVIEYLDPIRGLTVDQLVKTALDSNPELIAMRKEAEAGEALLRQARLRPNPVIEVNGARQVGGSDNQAMLQGELPLELGGRRSARIRVADRELEIRRLAAAERERQIIAEVRSKFGEALAAALKLDFNEQILTMARQNFELVAARVTEGRTPPLELNLEMVELNRMRAEREAAEGAVEVRMFELRNLVGMSPEDPLRIKGDFTELLTPVPPQDVATARALQIRPDLAGARAVEQLAGAQIEQARSQGRIDADVMLGYQRMQSGFHPLLGIDESTGTLLPIEDKFHFFTFGMRLNLPVRNRNQGAIAAAQLEAEAARNRREFGELTIKREIAAAYARYNRALRAMEIYRVGVRDQAAGNLNVVRQTYDLGSKTLLDYIAEHHRYMEVANGFIDTQLEAYLARVEILKAVYAAELLSK